MGRSMLVVEGEYGDLIIKLINTHLESLRNFASKRKAQFKECIEKLNQFGNEPGVFAIFGGDLNIRDEELCTLPSEIQDAWVAAGQLKEHEYTWDMIRNEPKDVIMRNARCRFDRIYFTGIYKNVEFWLDGTERDDVAKCFPSDHFAVCCRFFSPT
uniref:Uncharacterized protein n=1 Tax=Acrobeloides nanus TaxID=290746 RepID=A0A914C9Y2_9BILA